MIFCKIEGIDGESLDDKHKKWIGVTNVSHGLQQTISEASTTGGRTGGGAFFQDVTFSKVVDTSTPDLNLYCASGKHIPKVEIEFCLETDEKHVFLKYTLEDVIISSVSINASAGPGSAAPTESVSLNTGTIQWEYTAIDEQGSPAAKIDRKWSLTEQKKV